MLVGWQVLGTRDGLPFSLVVCSRARWLASAGHVGTDSIFFSSV